MSEIRLLILTGFVAIGVVLGGGAPALRRMPPVPRSLVAGVLVATLVMMVAGRSWPILGLLPLLGLLLSVRANQIYQPLPPGQYQGPARLVTDPRPTNHGWRAEVELENGKRVLMSGSGFAADPLARSGSGDLIQVEGRIKTVPDRSWFRSRHLVGKLTVVRVQWVTGPHWHQAPSEWLRSAISAGARTLEPKQRNLYLGLVIGDDRFQTDAQRAQFRTAGLSHLLAVSGQNVAFVLAAAAPALRRLGIGNRLILTLGLLALFAIATRMEASVLRATFTAGIATWSIVLGRRSTGLRTLCLAVIALLLIDPLLSQSVGFGLSVGASLGILLLGPVISRRLPGPTVLAEPLAITMAAQIGVSPLLIWIFGPVSLVSIPANVLVGWAAGMVMTWGLTIGILAGAAPAWMASIVQTPALLMLWWIDAVAQWAARVPAPVVGGVQALIFLVGISVWWWIRDWTETASRLFRQALIVAILVLSLKTIPYPPSSGTELVGGGTWWVEEGTGRSILVVAGNPDSRLVDALVSNRVRSIDLVIVERGHRSVSQVMADVQRVVTVGEVLAPADHRIVGGRRLLGAMVVHLQDGRSLVIEPVESGVVVSVSGMEEVLED